MFFLDLFWVFFQVGLFSVGGGYATIPIIQDLVVDERGWLTLEQFVDIVTVSQMTPGPIAINLATFVGTTQAGFFGAIIATLGAIAPACIIVLLLSYFYFKYNDLAVIKGVLNGLRPAVVALIASAMMSILLLSLFLKELDSWFDARISYLDVRAFVIFVLAFIVVRRFKLNPIYVILSSGVIGLVVYLMIG